MLLGGRSPDFRRVCGSQDFLLAAPSRSLSSGLSPLSFRLQWRGPRRHFTGFPHLPTNACDFPRRKNHCQEAALFRTICALSTLAKSRDSDPEFVDFGRPEFRENFDQKCAAIRSHA